MPQFLMFLILFLMISCNDGSDKLPDEIYNKIGLEIREARILRGLTQQELADSVDLTQNSLSLIEDGMATPMHTKIIEIQYFLDTVFYIDSKNTTIEEYLIKHKKQNK